MISDHLTASPITKRALAEKLGMHPREVEAAVQEARLAGAPIVSDSDGYRLSNDPQEVAACATALRRRYITQAVTARALRRTARRLEGVRQVSLW